MNLSGFRPVLLFLSGVFGAAGVGLAAAAAHVSGTSNLLAPASSIALAHAPAMLVLYLAHDKVKTATLAGLVIALGTLLFCADLVIKQFTGNSLFPMAAPSGGVLMMLGWLLLAAGAVFKKA